MEQVRIADVDPAHPAAQVALTAYTQEVREAAGLVALDVDAALQDIAGFTGDGGFFLIATAGDTVVGCVGLRRLSPDAAEIKRMWVAPVLRGSGLAVELLEQTEQRAVRRGYSRLFLDTNGALTAALRFYAAHGYEAIERYNDNPDATHFFAKTVEGDSN
ncbi:MAG: GNAT family N-acetyltransferase [Actinobacteria bacterium]|nr:GNAT family N-acetyltransferase [Actinomycetota bacterium]MCB8996032.1 GNAT family N-acetyltransferase [Actinomycetota bacterium]MCB9424428.1 GNAT family N-acetyltransferase [Actinomycetota bacterium]HRY08420.1 GNAT family N-acetyltransferase [Candidatus Nanopelagicales bacterium]